MRTEAMNERPADISASTSSTGHALAAVAYLDAHFAMCRPEYEAMAHSVGLQPGWHVLDAGCGRGSYVPIIAEMVGPTGAIAALDLAPENIASVEQSIAIWVLPTPVRAHLGSIVALPFPDDSFDAVWCANTTQYLTDDELATALGEFRRVVRPGGLVAIKEGTSQHLLYAPADPLVYVRLLDAVRDRYVSIAGVLRSPQTRRWLEAAGLEAVWQRTTLIERWAPLDPFARERIIASLVGLAAIALRDDVGIPKRDKRFWRGQRDPASPEHLVNQPDCYWCEGHVLAVGRVADQLVP
ncbi:MAG: class I SAM-dependent methyltransferase [Thermomicrobiales bacterium]